MEFTRKILNLLERNATYTTKDIAELLGEEEVCVAEEIARLKEEGVILGAVLKAEPGNASLLMEAASKNIAERQTLLDHRSKSLGSTMNSCFSNGHMPLRYYILFRLYNLWLRIVDKDSSSRQSRSKVFLCKIAGYGNITKYISDQDVIIFNWLDDEADDAFPLYLEFMSKVFRTDKVEIEIIK